MDPVKAVTNPKTLSFWSSFHISSSKRTTSLGCQYLLFIKNSEGRKEFIPRFHPSLENATVLAYEEHIIHHYVLSSSFFYLIRRVPPFLRSLHLFDASLVLILLLRYFLCHYVMFPNTGMRYMELQSDLMSEKTFELHLRAMLPKRSTCSITELRHSRFP